MKQLCIKYWKWKVLKGFIIDAAHEHLNNLTTKTRSLEYLMCIRQYTTARIQGHAICGLKECIVGSKSKQASQKTVAEDSIIFVIMTHKCRRSLEKE